jgi:hypothetical protein
LRFHLRRAFLSKTAIFSEKTMIKKLFGGKKAKFYAELDEAAVEASAPPVAAPPKPAAVPEPDSETAATPEATPASQSAPKSKKTSAKKTKQKESTAVAPPAAIALPPAPKKEEPKQVEFAAQNLLTPTLVRRRPGPSLSPFKAMAREVKVPNRR